MPATPINTQKNGKAGDCSSHANTGRRQDRKLDAISLAGGSRADRGRGPLDNSLQFRNAGAAIGAGAKRSPDIGDVCGTSFSHSAADGFKSDTVTGADDRPGFGNALGASTVYLERSVNEVVKGGWAVFEDNAGVTYPFAIGAASDRSAADYGLSGRVTVLELLELDGVTPIAALPALAFRTTTAFVQSVPLTPAAIPIPDDIDDYPSQIMLASMVLGLSIGQPVATIGTQSDPAGAPAAEPA